MGTESRYIAQYMKEKWFMRALRKNKSQLSRPFVKKEIERAFDAGGSDIGAYYTELEFSSIKEWRSSRNRKFSRPFYTQR